MSQRVLESESRSPRVPANEPLLVSEALSEYFEIVTVSHTFQESGLYEYPEVATTIRPLTTCAPSPRTPHSST